MGEDLPYGGLTRADRARAMRQIARDALPSYPVEVRGLTRLAHGFNTAFRVDAADGTRYVLRVHRLDGPTPAMIESELHWLAALRRDTDLAVPEPVRTSDGRLCTTARRAGGPEQPVCDLLRWIPGRFIDAGLAPSHLRQVGLLTARLHEHATALALPAGFERGPVDNVTTHAAASPSDNLSDEVAALAMDLVGRLVSDRGPVLVGEVIAGARAVRDRVGQGPGVFGLIHGDLHQENYLFDGPRICVIDFDDCGYGLHAYDLAVTLSELRRHANSAALRVALLGGYREVRSFSAEAEAGLPALIAFRYLQLMIYGLEHRDPTTPTQVSIAKLTGSLAQLEQLAHGPE